MKTNNADSPKIQLKPPRSPCRTRGSRSRRWLLIRPGRPKRDVDLRVTGTLGVLRSGAEQGLVNVPDLLERLKATSFYLDETLLNAVFGRWLKR